MEKVKYEVVLLDDTTVTQQIHLFKQAFGLSIDDNSLLDFWEKKHYQNPLGKSLIFGVFINDELVGMNAYLPSTFNYDGETIKCLQSCESGVSPAYQGKGIWGTVVRYAVDYIFSYTEYEFIFGFPNYRNSYPGFLKMKWKVVENMKNFILINNHSTFVRTITSSKIACKLSFLLALQKIMVKVYSSKKIRIEKCQAEDLLWSCDNGFFSVVPSLDWIKWKADYKKEHFLKVLFNDEVLATCIYILDDYKGTSVVRLDKVTISKNKGIKTKTILATILNFLSNENPESAFIRTWTTEKSALYSVFKGLFLLKSSHPNPFIIKSAKDMDSSMLWDLTFYDLD